MTTCVNVTSDCSWLENSSLCEMQGFRASGYHFCVSLLLIIRQLVLSFLIWLFPVWVCVALLMCWCLCVCVKVGVGVGVGVCVV